MRIVTIYTKTRSNVQFEFTLGEEQWREIPSSSCDLQTGGGGLSAKKIDSNRRGGERNRIFRAIYLQTGRREATKNEADHAVLIDAQQAIVGISRSIRTVVRTIDKVKVQ